MTIDTATEDFEELVLNQHGMFLANDNGVDYQGSDTGSAKARLWSYFAKLAWPRLNVHHADLYHDANLLLNTHRQSFLDLGLWFTVGETGTGIGYGKPVPIELREHAWLVKVKLVARPSHIVQYRAYFEKIDLDRHPRKQLDRIRRIDEAAERLAEKR